MNLGGEGCSEPRSCHCTPAWAKQGISFLLVSKNLVKRKTFNYKFNEIFAIKYFETWVAMGNHKKSVLHNFGKVLGYKINVQKLQAFLYTNNR